ARRSQADLLRTRMHRPRPARRRHLIVRWLRHRQRRPMMADTVARLAATAEQMADTAQQLADTALTTATRSAEAAERTAVAAERMAAAAEQMARTVRRARGRWWNKDQPGAADAPNG